MEKLPGFGLKRKIEKNHSILFDSGSILISKIVWIMTFYMSQLYGNINRIITNMI